jgi:magnesium dechelatase
MAHLNPEQIRVSFNQGAQPDGPTHPRAYTLTHSDLTGELFLTIGKTYNRGQVSGIYTRLMRDEVLAEWSDDEQPSLHVHCHVSGGLVFGTAGYREATFRHHMPMVLEAFYYGEQTLVELHPELGDAPVIVHFHTRLHKWDKVETWGVFENYKIQVARVTINQR